MLPCRVLGAALGRNQYREAVIFLSPGSRSAPWVSYPNDEHTLKGFHNGKARQPMTRRTLYNAFSVNMELDRLPKVCVYDATLG